MPTPYPIRPWRTAYDILVCWLVIAAAIALVVSVSWWFYPVVAIVIANRILALSLLCHEGLHGNLHPNLKVNDFIGRYFCAYPSFVSFSKYRRLHLLHHGTVGSEKWDPDRHLYNHFPKRSSEFIINQIARLVTLRTLYDFVIYYMEVPELLTRKRLVDGRLFALSSRSDLIPLLLFHAGVLGLAAYFDFLPQWLLLVTLPVLVITQPYVILMGGLQHGPIPVTVESGVSRSIHGSKIYMWLLLPCDICFHAEHHRNSSVPHYWLQKYSRDLERDGASLWRGSYREALRELFPKVKSN